MACNTAESDHPPILNAVIGGFSSPNYGFGQYHGQSTCFWRIVTKKNDQVTEIVKILLYEFIIFAICYDSLIVTD